jgi:Fe2+ transport system protein B
MRQTKREMHEEVITNQVLGIAYGWLVVFLVFPFLTELSQFWLATVSSVIFFIGSYTRAYLVRTYFDRRKHGYR